jgi:hypothetical protein
MIKLEQKEVDNEVLEKEKIKELEAKKKADERRRRERKYLEAKHLQEVEAKKNKKIESSLTKEDERYISKEAKRRKEIADSLGNIVDKQKDELIKYKIDAKKDREKQKEIEIASKEERRKLKEQRKIDAEKNKQLLEATAELKERLKEKKTLERKIEAAKRASMLKEEKRKAAEEIKIEMSTKRKAQSRLNDSLLIEEKLLAEKLAPLQAEKNTKEAKISDLKLEIARLKSQELPLLRDYLQINQKGKSLIFQTKNLVGEYKIEKMAEATKIQKEGLEVKLKVKENYLERLGKDRQVNIYRQNLAVLNERIQNLDTSDVNSDEINKILLIQYGQIEKALIATEKEMEQIIIDIENKEEQYNMDLMLADSARNKERKDSLEAIDTKLTPDEVSSRIDSLKKQYQNSKSGAVKASIQKKMNRLYVQLPEGIHEEVLYQDNRTIKKYIVSKGGEVTIYKMVMYSWGTTYYFKNGVAITKLRFDADTRY